MGEEIKSRLSGTIYKGNEVAGYVYNCIKVIKDNLAGEEREEYLGDITINEKDDAEALSQCKTKYGGKS